MNQSIFISLFQSSQLRGLKKLETERVRQILHGSTAMELYCQKDEHIDHMFLRAFVVKELTTGYVNGASSIQMAVDKKLVKSSLAIALSQPAPFEKQIFFDSVILVETFVAMKLLFLQHSYNDERRICFAVQHVLTA